MVAIGVIKVAKYTMNFSTFKYHSPEIVSLILQLPSVSQIIFPNKVYTSETSHITFNSESDFKFSKISEFYTTDLSVQPVFYTDRGINLTFNIGTSSVDDNPSLNVVCFNINDFAFSEFMNLHVLKSIFEEIIPLLKAHSGMLYYKPRNIASGMHCGFTEEGKYYQSQVSWINYYGPEFLEFASQERFLNLCSCFENYEFHGGRIVILQSEPYDDRNLVHRQRLENLTKELNFEELIERMG